MSRREFYSCRRETKDFRLLSEGVQITPCSLFQNKTEDGRTLSPYASVLYVFGIPKRCSHIVWSKQCPNVRFSMHHCPCQLHQHRVEKDRDGSPEGKGKGNRPRGFSFPYPLARAAQAKIPPTEPLDATPHCQVKKTQKPHRDHWTRPITVK